MAWGGTMNAEHRVHTVVRGSKQEHKGGICRSGVSISCRALQSEVYPQASVTPGGPNETTGQRENQRRRRAAVEYAALLHVGRQAMSLEEAAYRGVGPEALFRSKLSMLAAGNGDELVRHARFV
jgi:hypothetical protein